MEEKRNILTEEQKAEAFENYNNRTHVIGRIVCIITLILLTGAPFVMGAVLGAMPDFKAVGKGFLSIGIVYFVSCIAEYLVYTPMLGAGGTYLAFITGNLINMKIPYAINARDIVGAKTGTAENEIISTLSIATSSLVTILVLAAGVALLIPLQPVLQNPALICTLFTGQPVRRVYLCVTVMSTRGNALNCTDRESGLSLRME